MRPRAERAGWPVDPSRFEDETICMHPKIQRRASDGLHGGQHVGAGFEVARRDRDRRWTVFEAASPSEARACGLRCLEASIPAVSMTQPVSLGRFFGVLGSGRDFPQQAEQLVEGAG